MLQNLINLGIYLHNGLFLGHVSIIAERVDIFSYTKVFILLPDIFFNDVYTVAALFVHVLNSLTANLEHIV